jgi:hypothetical protein
MTMTMLRSIAAHANIGQVYDQLVSSFWLVYCNVLLSVFFAGFLLHRVLDMFGKFNPVSVDLSSTKGRLLRVSVD